jgi:hypothetical protein
VRIHRIGLVTGLLLAAQLAGTGCILIPKIEKRNVRLVVSQYATVPVHATGAINTGTFTGSLSGNLGDIVSIRQALDNAGIDVSKVDSVVVGKIEYRVSTADATPGRQITAAQVQVSTSGSALTDLIVGFSHPAGAVTPWLRADLTPAGVARLNALLSAVVREIRFGSPAADQRIGYSVSGVSAPTTTATDFWYEIRITLLISGTVETSVPN